MAKNSSLLVLTLSVLGMFLYAC
ncbi:MAG: hypothetical protein RLZ62_1459, partial [Bacteroidota bacterium]